MIDIGYGGVSYRTVKEDIDLGQEIAHSFGGGGHRKAAGSSFDGNEMRSIVLNEVFGLSLGTSHMWRQD
jgi:nanoRNase/pAp phosphatase (c-di-AMP/oligoRNAs hydrolase)